MSIYQKVKRVVFDYPAYEVVELEQDTNGCINLKARDTLVFETWHGTFSICSAASYALENGKCPIESFVECVERGHEAYWINGNASVLSNSPSAKYRCIYVERGQKYHFEGKVFQIDTAANQNLRLIPVEA